ncbi:hypothetical protein Ccrd_006468 [Cynara cardunculus var. scolymus]|uniref:Uncharacterized protein n=1 Tax=Cynara cardunculus var. scolymus TaxID=59895 RepID=A0A103XIY8_CYNCS|nr:hypothetical protein Ccrd_006468 [Cynara cardunculus var. scolymus]
MRRRLRRKSSAADLLIAPPSLAATPNRSLTESPKIFNCSSSCFNTPTNSFSSLKEDSRSNNNSSKKPAAEPPTSSSPAPAMSSLNKASSRIADLKEMASSRIDSIKRQIDCSYIGILKDMEVSHSRLHKRYKILTGFGELNGRRNYKL